MFKRALMFPYKLPPFSAVATTQSAIPARGVRTAFTVMPQGAPRRTANRAHVPTHFLRISEMLTFSFLFGSFSCALCATVLMLRASFHSSNHVAKIWNENGQWFLSSSEPVNYANHNSVCSLILAHGRWDAQAHHTSSGVVSLLLSYEEKAEFCLQSREKKCKRSRS